MIKEIYKLFVKYPKINTDTRRIEKNAIFFALKGENFNANKFALQALEKGAAYAIIDEKKYQVDKRMILVSDVLDTLQQLANHHRNQLDVTIVALTGSNGKTTTKELLYAVLSQAFNVTATIGNLNNHIGVPLTLLSMHKNTQIGIVEMGANHPKEIEFLCKIANPDYGYITNFGKAHLEGFGDLNGVIRAKTELYNYLKDKDKIVFVNNDDTVQVKKSKGIKQETFGAVKADYNIEFINAKPLVIVKYNETTIKSNLIGIYNYSNIAAAIAIGCSFGVATTSIKKGIENYMPKNNRSQIINKGTNKIILDAYNANPTSMLCALDNFEQLKDKHKIAILGDMFELGNFAVQEHQTIATIVNKFKTIDAIYLIGENFNNVKNSSKKITTYSNYNSFLKQFKKNKINNTTILIKASRGMALERLLDFIE